MPGAPAVGAWTVHNSLSLWVLFLFFSALICLPVCMSTCLPLPLLQAHILLSNLFLFLPLSLSCPILFYCFAKQKNKQTNKQKNPKQNQKKPSWPPSGSHTFFYWASFKNTKGKIKIPTHTSTNHRQPLRPWKSGVRIPCGSQSRCLLQSLT